MNGELLIVLEHLEREKGIQREVLIRAIESSLLSASKKRLGKADNISITIDEKTAEIKVFEHLDVVDKITDDTKEITLADARQIDPHAKIGTTIQKEITPDNFGRIAAQTAKQVIIQKIREAEKEIVFDEFKDRIGDIVNGIIRRNEHGNYTVDLGRTEGILPIKEQCQTDSYATGYRMRFYVLDVRNTNKGPAVLLSRTHPGLVQKLFELEVPEISEGTVIVKSVAREPGYRAKISVESKLEKVDSVGACVGLRGERVKNIVRELNGEKIDIIKYSNNISTYVENALSPAKIDSIRLNEKKKSMEIIVPSDQFSLAIGKKGQNARLTSKLIGWKVDIKRKEDADKDRSENYVLDSIQGLPESVKEELSNQGYYSISMLESIDLETIMSIKGVGEKTAPKFLTLIQEFVKKEKSKTKLDTIIAEKSKELQI